MFFSKVGKSSVKITSDGVEAKIQAKSKHGNINQTITSGNGNTQIVNCGKESSSYNQLEFLKVELRYLDGVQDMTTYVRRTELSSRDANNWIGIYDKNGTTLGTVNLRLVRYIKYLD
ncbi:hypothetical protein SY212_03460 [Ligilactobacillus agilis]|uniref:Uncharacterized protein n=1 Tax=Ligilactobacillus agilis TaxID=1601 RepID=A0A6F9XJ94_9LACO|nr:hypothetical protein [Ligilactobacillus agilis]GET05316.1 hypothetical protein SY212_03460 [Ligilactobacillus agilis]